MSSFRQTVYAVATSLVLTGCAIPKVDDLMGSYGINSDLSQARYQALHCRFEPALDTLQQYTVIGSNREKAYSFELMGIIYAERNEYDMFDHTVERYLFSEMGKHKDKGQVVLSWQSALDQLRLERAQEMGQDKCLQTNYDGTKPA